MDAKQWSNVCTYTHVAGCTQARVLGLTHAHTRVLCANQEQTSTRSFCLLDTVTAAHQCLCYNKVSLTNDLLRLKAFSVIHLLHRGSMRSPNRFTGIYFLSANTFCKLYQREIIYGQMITNHSVLNICLIHIRRRKIQSTKVCRRTTGPRILVYNNINE